MRVFSFAQESTRYCNYSKDKFGNELTFIIPSWSTVNEEHLKPRVKSPSMAEGVMLRLFMHAESDYLYMLEQGLTPQQARQVLPNALKTEVVMTGFIEDWDLFFGQRARGKFTDSRGREHISIPHPDMLALTKPLLEEFIKRGYINGI